MLSLGRAACLCLALLTFDPVDIDKSPLRDGRVGAPYADTLRLRSDLSATWELRSGRLPPGVSLDRGSGELAGEPTQSGEFSFDVRARRDDDKSSAKFEITVAEGETVNGVSIEDAIEALLGVAGGLDPEIEQSLDRQGNDNGRFDVGDVQAYLRARRSAVTSTNTKSHPRSPSIRPTV